MKVNISCRDFLTASGQLAEGALIGLGAGTVLIHLPIPFAPNPIIPGVSKLQKPSPQAALVFKRICNSVGIRSNITLLSGSFYWHMKKAAAFAKIQHGRRYIVYDRNFYVFRRRPLSWKAVKVLAHEVGHHLGSHTSHFETSGQEKELEADRFAGFAMARMGASEEQALSVFSWDWPGSRSHPPARIRRQATREGWLLGQRMKKSEMVKLNDGPQSCTAGFVGDESQVESRACRIVKTCNNDEANIRLSCQNDDGVWVWQ